MTSQLKAEGRITKVSGFGFFQVELDNGHLLLSKACGKMSRRKIRLNLHDRVRVRMSEFDLSKAVIEWRL